MKKKIISLLVLIAAVLAATNIAFAANEVNPKVIVDDRVLTFYDQAPVINQKGDTLMPVRAVLEAMGATVEWNAQDRSVYVKAKDNIIRLLMKIDQPTMTKYTLTSVFTVKNEEVALTSAPIIMNDRTMIPLRAISENINAKVDWDGEKKLITIKTKEYTEFMDKNSVIDENDQKVYNPKEVLPYVYIEADKTEVKKGEKVVIDVKIANTKAIKNYTKFSSFNCGLFYDKEVLDVKSCKAIVNGVEATSVLGGSNPDFEGNSLKYVYIIMPNATDVDTALKDGSVARIVFEALEDFDTTEITLSNRITDRGSDTAFSFDNDEGKFGQVEKPDELWIDVTPIQLNK